METTALKIRRMNIEYEDDFHPYFPSEQNLAGDNCEIAGAGKIYAGRDFQTLIQSKSPLVDKSMFIKELMDDPNVNILITRPKKFGKSINLSMLRNFLMLNSTSERLFKNLSISREIDFCKKHQNKHPTLHLSFAGMTGATFDECKKHLAVMVNNMYYEHVYLGTSLSLSEQEKKDFAACYTGSVASSKVPFSISKLIGLMRKHFEQKVVVLLEDYDVPMTIAYTGKFQNEIIDFLRIVIEDIFNSDSIEKGVIMGMFTENKNLFWGLKNKGVYTVCHHKYSEYFGFLESDVKTLAMFYKIGAANIVDKIKDFYAGYSIGGNILYNPLSVHCCLRSGGTLGHFWMEASESTVFLDTILMESGGVLPPLKVDMLLQGIEIETHFEPDTSPEMILREGTYWSYLLQFGFLTVSHQETGTDGKITVRLRIPNKEIRDAIAKAIKDYHTEYEVPRYHEFVDSVRLNDSKKAQKILDSYLKESALFFIEDRSLQRVADLMKGLEPIFGTSRLIDDKGDFYIFEMKTDKAPSDAFTILLIRADNVPDKLPTEEIINNSVEKVRNHFAKKGLKYMVFFVHYPSKMDFLASKTYKKYIKRNPMNDSFTQPEPQPQPQPQPQTHTVINSTKDT